MHEMCNSDWMCFMRKNKKVIFSFILVIFIMLIFVMLNAGDNYQHIIYANWGVDFCTPKKLESIFMYDYREGEDFLIWSYDDDKFDKTLSKNKFSLISTENIKRVEQYLSEFYSRLDKKEKELFDKNVEVNSLIKPNNYYLYIDEIKDYIAWENRNFVIIIADFETRKMYYFNAIW